MFDNKFAALFITAALAAALLAGCSPHKSISRDEAVSEIRAARSTAAAAQLLIDFVLQGHSTRHYAEGQTIYLQASVERSLNKLKRAVAEPGAEDSVHQCQTTLDKLAHELAAVRAAIVHGDTNALARARRRMSEIQQSPGKANPSS